MRALDVVEERDMLIRKARDLMRGRKGEEELEEVGKDAMLVKSVLGLQEEYYRRFHKRHTEKWILEKLIEINGDYQKAWRALYAYDNYSWGMRRSMGYKD